MGIDFDNLNKFCFNIMQDNAIRYVSFRYRWISIGKLNKEDGWGKDVHPVSKIHPIQDLYQWDYAYNDMKKKYILIVLLQDLHEQWEI
jgi:hypothetical protein